LVQRELRLSFYGPVCVDFRTVSDLFAGQVYRQRETVRQGWTNRVWRNQNFPAGEPLTRVDDIITDRPFVIVEVDVVDVADRSIGGNQGRAAEFSNAS
jgi:hypothetical protein